MSEETKGGWFGRLKAGLQRSSEKITTGITDLFTKRKLDAAALQDLEELLIQGDLGVTTATRLADTLRKTRFDQEVSPEEIRSALADEVATILEPVARPLEIDSARKPHVILVCGVNGSGKTTTIGKMARQFRVQGRSVLLAAGDHRIGKALVQPFAASARHMRHEPIENPAVFMVRVKPAPDKIPDTPAGLRAAIAVGLLNRTFRP